MSLRAYDSAKAQIELWVSKWREDDPNEAELIDRIDNLTHPRGKQQIVGVDRLWAVIAPITTAKAFYDAVLDDIHHLEQETGRD